MSKYILAHDLGTSGNKATLYTMEGQLNASYVYEYPTFYPEDGWVEQDPEDWWKAVCVSTKELLESAGVKNSEISCITFSGQMMGCLPVDMGGHPLRRSIIWADLRAVKQAEFIEKQLGMETVYRITGHRISASYSAAKIMWVRDNEPELYAKTYKVLHAKDYIIHRLTGAFVTDYSDAGGMNLFDLKNRVWSEQILNALSLCKDILPNPHPSTDIAGKITREASKYTGLLEGTSVVIGGGDGSCAAAGAGVVEEGKAYTVIGSSAWTSLASKEPIFDPEMRTFNWIHLDQNLYTPCGTMQTAGYSLNWLKNNLCGLEVAKAKEMQISPYQLIDEKIETSPAGANNLLFLPYLLGERSPRWNPDARGAFVGLRMTHTQADIYRSVLEGVAYNLRVIKEIFEGFTTIEDVILIGGGAKGRVWTEILADVWQKKVLIPQYLEEATSMGAAICGGVGIGAFKDFTVIEKFNPIVAEIQPRHQYKETYDALYSAFNKAYEALVPVYNML